MKKLLCLVMSVLMAVPLMMTAFAVEQKTEAEFEKYNLSAETEVNGGGTDYDRGRSVMLSMGFDEDLVDAKNTKKIGSISSISVSIPPSLSISFSSGGDKYTVQESALMFHVPDFRKVS